MHTKWVLSISVFLLISAFHLLDEGDQLIWNENFDAASTQWRTSNNADELFVIDNGEYLLWRKNQVSPSLVLPEKGDVYQESRIELQVRINAENPDGSAGLVVLAQQDGKGAYVFEVSGDQKFRVRKIQNSAFREVSGKAKNAGWVKEKFIKEAGQVNKLSVTYIAGTLILKINNEEAWNGVEYELKEGKAGVYIGPDSRAKLDNLQVYVNEDEAKRIKQARDNNDPARSALTDIIIQLRTTINAQNHEIDSLEKVSRKLEKENDRYENSPRNVRKLRAEVSQLKKEKATLEWRLRKAERELEKLEKFKKTIREGQNGDVIITLTNTLADEKDKNKKLQEENKALADTVKRLQLELRNINGDD